MEVVPGIHQLKVPIPGNMLGYTNVYLVQGSDGWLLVDTGSNYPETFDALQNQLREIGIDFNNISQIVVTHTHLDHYGLAGKVKQLSRAKLAFHQIENTFLQPRQRHLQPQ